ncbi:hypothetical protein B0H17DRAFT_1158148 [Mycena rosella]|uniref:Gag protein n=1 Tax=Mycena rosella TaxID=1033263 RepID=A0AAD7DUW3_MYCRO|nr:hypothetical protein B0H17DRAFT_1158148 [Mycena rosella]
MGLCTSYVAQFHELLPHIDFSNMTKLDQFKEGLKTSVRDLLCGVHPKSVMFDEYIKLAIEFDNDLYEDELNSRKHAHSSRLTAVAIPQTYPAPSTTSTEVVPMEVDTVKFRRPLTQDETDRRGFGGSSSSCRSSRDRKFKPDDARRRDADQR